MLSTVSKLLCLRLKFSREKKVLKLLRKVLQLFLRYSFEKSLCLICIFQDPEDANERLRFQKLTEDIYLTTLRRNRMNTMCVS